MDAVNPGGPRRAFELLPAIDLRGRRVVRLRQGDFARETVYGDDPVATARRFQRSGATWLHIVDLDGALAGRPVQDDIVRAILDAVGDDIAIEVSGGLRDEPAVEAALAAGARRVVVGTAVLADPALAGRLVARHGSERIVAALDVRDGRAIGEGWSAGATGVPVHDAARRLAEVGVGTFAVTAIARDGLLAGPDLDLLTRLVEADVGRVIASGGVAGLDDLAAVRRVGCVGAIVGRAIYDGTLDLAAAIAATRD